MDPRLKEHLWNSPIVRAALRKELLRSLIFIVIYVGANLCGRYFTDRSIEEGFLAGLVGAAVMAIYLFLCVVKAIRHVLEEDRVSMKADRRDESD